MRMNEHDICIKGDFTPSSQRARSFGFMALGELGVRFSSGVLQLPPKAYSTEAV